jgi:hypothetical protein
MIKIAHRGNTHGPKPELENTPEYIDQALEQGYDVELDIWIREGSLYLGHDKPETYIEKEFLFNRRDLLWCHAKNLDALVWLLQNGMHTFYHDKDDYILTSKGFIWPCIGSTVSENTMCVMPEKFTYDENELKYVKGICSDFISKY